MHARVPTRILSRVRPVVLTVAGSDSSGGAGIQADLTAIRTAGAQPATVVTAVTAQSTRRVARVHVVPDDVVDAQLDVVLNDLPIASAKTGMLATVAQVEAVACRLAPRSLPLVVDPVLVATSGDRLASLEVAEAMRQRLFPLATVITPNLAELDALTGGRASTPTEMAAAGRRLLDDGAPAVLVKGGHLPGRAIDILVTREATWSLTAERAEGSPVHGTGCTLAALVACHLAFARPLLDAVRAAKAMLTPSIQAARSIGAGARLLAPTTLNAPVGVRSLTDAFQS